MRDNEGISKQYIQCNASLISLTTTLLVNVIEYARLEVI